MSGYRSAWYVFTAILACSVSACDRENSSSAPRIAETASGWNSVDACSTVGTEAIAKATSQKVTGAELGPVSEAAEGKAPFSMCTFALSSGGKVSVLIREAIDSRATADDIVEARTPGVDGMAATEELPNMGRAALWGQNPPALQLFIDDRRYAVINIYNSRSLPDASLEAKAAAVAIARGLIS